VSSFAGRPLRLRGPGAAAATGARGVPRAPRSGGTRRPRRLFACASAVAPCRGVLPACPHSQHLLRIPLVPSIPLQAHRGSPGTAPPQVLRRLETPAAICGCGAALAAGDLGAPPPDAAASPAAALLPMFSAGDRSGSHRAWLADVLAALLLSAQARRTGSSAVTVRNSMLPYPSLPAGCGEGAGRLTTCLVPVCRKLLLCCERPGRHASMAVLPLSASGLVGAKPLRLRAAACGGFRAPCVGGGQVGAAQLSRDAALTDALLHSIVPGRTHASPPCQRRARGGALFPKP